MRKPVTLGIVAIICLIALLAFDRMAFAQSGSTGGTIGKTDKSVSGGEETAPTKHPPGKSVAAERATVSRSITAGWLSFWGTYHLRQSGKTFTWVMGGQTAHGTINGHELRASWFGGPSSGSGKGMISEDGNTIMWDNGVVFRRQ